MNEYILIDVKTRTILKYLRAKNLITAKKHFYRTLTANEKNLNLHIYEHKICFWKYVERQELKNHRE